MSITRKLASIQYVHHVDPIPNADAIECIGVLGWKLVAKKGEFKVGDICIYFEVDSFLPEKEEFEFLRKTSFKDSPLMGRGFRLKTMKMRGQISQGLALPISYLPEDNNGKPWEIGDDVTDILSVKKWEIEEKITKFGLTAGSFPDGIVKSDEIRVQSIPEIFSELGSLNQNKYLYISTKMDGSSVTVYYKNHHFGVCSRNLEIKEEGSLLWDFFKQRRIPENISAYCEANGLEVAIQGEFCGAGIQNNRLKLIKPNWYVFTVQLLGKDGTKRMNLDDIYDWCTLLECDHVPVEELLTVESFLDNYGSVEKCIQRARGKYPSGLDKEGIVIRPTLTCYSNVLQGPLSFKVINNDYLLKDKS